jgi:NCS2 family nucleobase:cation symporter-2
MVPQSGDLPQPPEEPATDRAPPAPVHPVDEWLPAGRLFLYGLQHVLAMYAGAVAVPLIVAHALGLPRAQLVYLINADLFTCGVATLVQTVGFWRIGVRLPVIQGCTFAAVTPMILIGRSLGLTAIYGAVMVAGAVTFLVAPWFGRLLRFFPAVVTGTIITIIGLSLLPVAVRWSGGGDPADPRFGAPREVALAFAVLVLILLYNRFLRGFLRNIAVLLGLLSGTLVAALLGLVDLSGVRQAPWLGLTTPLAFGRPTLNLAAIASMVLVMLTVMIETSGDFIAVAEIVERPLGAEDLARGLRADGFSTVLGGLFNAFPYTAYAQNIGLVGLTGVRSRFVVAAAGVILCTLGLLPKAAALVAAIPAPVLGGAALIMFGTVAASGIRTLARVRFDGNHNALIVATSLAIGLIPIGAGGFYQHFPAALQVVLQSGITAGSVAAILLHALLGEPRGSATSERVSAN